MNSNTALILHEHKRTCVCIEIPYLCKLLPGAYWTGGVQRCFGHTNKEKHHRIAK
jgi:hypothetical protein